MTDTQKMKQLEEQIKGLQLQVQFLLNKVGKLPINTHSPWSKPMTDWTRPMTMTLQKLSTDGCTTLKEWLQIHDTDRLVPGHCVQFQKQLEHTLELTTYVYGWEQLQEMYSTRLRHNYKETKKQWNKGMCPYQWVVLEHTQLPIKGDK